MSRENQSNMEKESNYYEENVCLPFKMEVELQNHIESFISIMRVKYPLFKASCKSIIE